MKRKHVVVIIIIVVIILIAISSSLIYKKYFKKIQDELPPEYDGGTVYSGGGNSTPTAPINPSFPLRKGMSGPMISDVQNAVNKKCGANLIPDGKFGPLTESAVKSCYGVTQISETLYTQMKFDGGGEGGCPEGQYRKPGIGCVSINPSASTGPVSVATGFGLKKGDMVVSRMPTLTLFSAPVGNSSIGKISNLDTSKAVGVYEAVASTEFSKLWLNLNYVKNNGLLGQAPAWVYVYTSLIKKK